MTAAAGIVCLNVGQYGWRYGGREYGWPEKIACQYDGALTSLGNPHFFLVNAHWIASKDMEPGVIDFGVAFLILHAVYFACEWRSRRSEKQNADQVANS